MLYTTINLTTTTRNELKDALREAREAGLTDIKLNVSTQVMLTECERLQADTQSDDGVITYEQAMEAAQEALQIEAEIQQMLDEAQARLDAQNLPIQNTDVKLPLTSLNDARIDWDETEDLMGVTQAEAKANITEILNNWVKYVELYLNIEAGCKRGFVSWRVKSEYAPALGYWDHQDKAPVKFAKIKMCIKSGMTQQQAIDFVVNQSSANLRDALNMHVKRI